MPEIPFINPSIRVVDNNGYMMDQFKYLIRQIYDYFESSVENVIALSDDEEILLEAKPGYGFCMIGDNQEYAAFTFTSEGVVTLLTDVSANIADTDSDGNLCIYDNGSSSAIKNRLGSTLNLRYSIKYSNS